MPPAVPSCDVASSNEPQQGVQVVVRVRPQLPKELHLDNAVEALSVRVSHRQAACCDAPCTTCHDNEQRLQDKDIVVFKGDAEFASAYDCVLGSEASQHDVYTRAVQASVRASAQGYNCTVFAYGQTGTGKTHTMLGPHGASLSTAADMPDHVGSCGGSASTSQHQQHAWDKLGVIPRAAKDLFTQLEERAEEQGLEITVLASFVEIYNDTLYDLLRPHKQGKAHTRCVHKPDVRLHAQLEYVVTWEGCCCINMIRHFNYSTACCRPHAPTLQAPQDAPASKPSVASPTDALTSATTNTQQPHLTAASSGLQLAACQQASTGALEVREDRKRGGMYVHGAKAAKVGGLSGLLGLIRSGNRHRAVRHTDMNQNSSRSHVILQLIIDQRPRSTAAAVAASVHHKVPMAVRSKLNFVDLAGSERWNKADEAIGLRVSELTAINSSLSALGKVVAALQGRTSAQQHIPYRDCKLTHLLQDSLGGNCRTVLIATVSPSVAAFEETVSTLKFADRARAITNNPTVNTCRDYPSMLALKEREIDRLRHLLAMSYTKSGASSGDSQSAAGPDMVDAATLGQLILEMQQLRIALESERQKRAELEARMQQLVALESSLRTSRTTMQPDQAAYPNLAAPPGTTPLVDGHGQGSKLPKAANGPIGAESRWAKQAFGAVMERRAELGLSVSVAHQAPAAAPKRDGSLRHVRPQSMPTVMTTTGAVIASSGAWQCSSRGRRAGGASASPQRTKDLIDQHATMTQDIASQIADLEQTNRERAAALSATARHARAHASPVRGRWVGAAMRSSKHRAVGAATANDGGRAPADTWTNDGGDVDDSLLSSPHHPTSPAARPRMHMKRDQQGQGVCSAADDIDAVGSADRSLPASSAATAVSGGAGWGRSAIMTARHQLCSSGNDSACAGKCQADGDDAAGDQSYGRTLPNVQASQGWGRSSLMGCGRKPGSSGGGGLVPTPHARGSVVNLRQSWTPNIQCGMPQAAIAEDALVNGCQDASPSTPLKLDKGDCWAVEATEG
jgi:kinesin family protein 3/17